MRMRLHHLVVLVWVGACGDDGASIPDAPMADAAYPAATCLIRGHYGDLGAQTGMQSVMTGPATTTVTLDAGPPRDTFFLKLTAGRGVFPATLMPGTFTIAGAETNSATCGVCVNIIADIVSMVGPTKFYFATSGMVTLTATDRPAGTISNVQLVEVTASGALVPNGCVASIGAMSFTTP